MVAPPLFQESGLTPMARLRRRFGDRAIGIAVAVAIELVLLLVLLTLGTGITRPGEPDGTAITSFDVAPAPPAEQPAETEPAAEQQPQAAEPQPRPQPQEQPPVPRPVVPDSPAPARPVLVLPRPDSFRLPAPDSAPAAAAPPRQAAAPQGPAYGPPAPPAGAGMPGDTERVGTAPNGEPMFAARWYREPTDSELAGYLSTANSPGYGLITCRVVKGYRVEECVGLSEEPQGSNLLRAVLAASWQFRVRPPRIGGKERFGEWVRIQITYNSRRVPR